MAKLFVAVDLPEAAKAAIVRLQPPPQSGLRLPEPSQMHLTLHFLGESGVARMSSALSRVETPAFALDLRGVGKFASPDGSVTLWAAVVPSPKLLAFHLLTATALAREGFVPEARPYAPHVTVARYGPGAAGEGVGRFLSGHADFTLHGLQIAEFGLYSSTFIDGAPSYRREQSFALS
jgi:2'-5' RNA ligase